ncbi:unnamed protein product, partial [Vitis vinifera]|uniref:Uncharacterized protein n=1 Tax=Vitis vinifera TaxID=29760 RepID=D7TMZ0_VITVI
MVPLQLYPSLLPWPTRGQGRKSIATRSGRQRRLFSSLALSMPPKSKSLSGMLLNLLFEAHLLLKHAINTLHSSEDKYVCWKSVFDHRLELL